MRINHHGIGDVDQINLISIDGINVHSVAFLEEEEFAFYEDACIELLSFDRWVALRFIYQVNGESFTRDLAEALAPKNQLIGHEAMGTVLSKLNLGLINYLTAMRLVLDHTETRLNRKFGESSSEFNIFKEATSFEFDNSFEYRFINKLRNFVQHCGLPLNHAQENATLLDRTTGASEHSFEVGFDPKVLLKEFKKWGILREQLEALPTYIPAEGLVETVTKCLDRVLDKSFAIEANSIIEKGRKLVDLIRPALSGWNGVGAGRSTVLDEGKRINSTVTDAPLTILARWGLISLPYVIEHH